VVPQNNAPVRNSPSAAPSLGGGLDILGEIFGTASISNTPVMATPPTDSLLDLLGGLTPMANPVAPVAIPITSTPSLVPAPQLVQPAPSNGALPTFTAFEKNGLTILFDTFKNAQFPNVTIVNITYVNSSSFPLVSFDFKAAVPKYIKLQVNPPSGNLIPPNNSGKVTQSIKIMNMEHGQKSVVLKMKIDYLVNGAPVSELADVNFPPGV